MTAGILLGLTLTGIVITALSAVGTLVLHEFPAHELEELCRRRRRDELFGDILDRHEQVGLGVRSLEAIGTTLFLIAGMLWIVGDGVPVGAGGWWQFAAWLGIGSFILLAATVWLPWAICGSWSAPFLFWTWPALLAVGRLFLPITLAGRLLEEILCRLSGRPVEEPDEEEAFEDEIRAIVSEGLHDGLLEADAREMIEGVIELADIDVADIMTPRFKMDVLPVDMAWSEVLEFVVRAGRTRIPVCGKSLDEIQGVLYVKDLLPELPKKADRRRPLSEMVRPATFVPRTKAVDDLLREFQRTHNHMAIVVDEYQAIAGLITIEDVLEEIVGEIVDEHDREEQDDLRSIDDHTAEALATAHLDEINEKLGIDLPEADEFDTIGGLVISRLGRIPKTGETVSIGNIRVTVIAATPRRIERVSIESLEANHKETA